MSSYNIVFQHLSLQKGLFFLSLFFFSFFNLAFWWSDCPKVRCMPIFVDESVQWPGLKQESCNLLSLGVIIMKTHRQSGVSRHFLSFSSTVFQLNIWCFLVVFFCIIDYRSFIFVVALCFAWLSASCDPSASYSVLWQGQGLLKTSLPPVKALTECFVNLCCFRCCFIWPFDDVSSEVICGLCFYFCKHSLEFVHK